MLELDLLGLREAELAGDIRDRLLRKHDRSRPRRANEADKLNVFDGLGESLQAPAVLLEKSHARPIDLAVNEQTNQAFMSQHRRKRQLALRHIERRDRFTQRLPVNV